MQIEFWLYLSRISKESLTESTFTPVGASLIAAEIAARQRQTDVQQLYT